MDTPLIFNEVVAFLRLHPEVSVRKLSIMANVPNMSLHRLLSKEHKDILSASADRIREVIKGYNGNV